MYLLIISIVLLDGIIMYYIPSYFNDISYLYPMFTVSLIPILYSYFSTKKYYLTSFYIGIIYDVLYGNIFLFNALLFLLLSKTNSKIYKFLKDNLFIKLVLTILNIMIYDTIYFILIKLSYYNVISVRDLIYKISHSLLLNILVVFVYFFLFKKLFSKHKI